MKTLAAWAISAMAFLQEPPRPPQPPPPPQATPQRRQDFREAEKRVDDLRARLDRTAEGSPERGELQRELRRAEAELERLRSQPPRAGVPQPPQPPRIEPPLRPLANLEEVRGWLRENEPETARRLAQLESEGRREEIHRVLLEVQGRMRTLAEMKERDPKAYERLQEMRRMERHSLELGERASRATGEERDKAAKELTDVLQKLFDLREESRAQELTELKRRVDAIEKAIQTRKAGKDKIVEKRRKELMGERPDDEW